MPHSRTPGLSAVSAANCSAVVPSLVTLPSVQRRIAVMKILVRQALWRSPSVRDPQTGQTELVLRGHDEHSVSMGTERMVLECCPGA